MPILVGTFFGFVPECKLTRGKKAQVDDSHRSVTPRAGSAKQLNQHEIPLHKKINHPRESPAQINS